MSTSFYRAPYLVDVDVVQGKRILRLEEVGRNGEVHGRVLMCCHLTQDIGGVIKDLFRGKQQYLTFLLACSGKLPKMISK